MLKKQQHYHHPHHVHQGHPQQQQHQQYQQQQHHNNHQKMANKMAKHHEMLDSSHTPTKFSADNSAISSVVTSPTSSVRSKRMQHHHSHHPRQPPLSASTASTASASTVASASTAMLPSSSSSMQQPQVSIGMTTSDSIASSTASAAAISQELNVVASEASEAMSMPLQPPKGSSTARNNGHRVMPTSGASVSPPIMSNNDCLDPLTSKDFPFFHFDR